ncbi:MAG: insulinase family protein [Mucilaginibacter sp.]|nr:insulinase family protein [Mucilaginibacter sp.]
MTDRTTAPEFKDIDHIELIKPDHIELDNGCNIFSFNSGDQ